MKTRHIRKFVPEPDVTPLTPQDVDCGVVVYRIDSSGCSEPRFALLTRGIHRNYGFAYSHVGYVQSDNLKFSAPTMKKAIEKAVDAGRNVYWLNNITQLSDLIKDSDTNDEDQRD